MGTPVVSRSSCRLLSPSGSCRFLLFGVRPLGMGPSSPLNARRSPPPLGRGARPVPASGNPSLLRLRPGGCVVTTRCVLRQRGETPGLQRRRRTAGQTPHWPVGSESVRLHILKYSSGLVSICPPKADLVGQPWLPVCSWGLPTWFCGCVQEEHCWSPIGLDCNGFGKGAEHDLQRKSKDVHSRVQIGCWRLKCCWFRGK
jgi:hypothetical protein